MSNSPEVTSFKIGMYLGLTVQVNGEAWMKPGISTEINFGGIPTLEQIQDATKYQAQQVLNPLMEEFLATITKEVERRGLQLR